MLHKLVAWISCDLTNFYVNFSFKPTLLMHVQRTYFNLGVRKYLFGNDLCSSATGYLYVKIINSNKDICFILSTRYKIIFVSLPLHTLSLISFLLSIISNCEYKNIIPRKPMGNGCSMIFLHHVGVFFLIKTETKRVLVPKTRSHFLKKGKKQVHRTAEYYFFFHMPHLIIR